MKNTHPAVTARRGDDAELVQVTEQYAFPSLFHATIEPADASAPVVHLTAVIEGGRPVCERLVLERRPDGPPVTGAALRRVPVNDYLTLAADRVGHWTLGATKGPVLMTVDGETYELPVDALEDGTLATRISGATRTAEYHLRRRQRATDEDLRKVADTYAAAFAAGRPPVKAVEDSLFVSRSTASRLVRKARERGLLDAGGPRRADSEQTP